MATTFSTARPTDHFNELELAAINSLKGDIYTSTTATTTVSTTISRSALSLDVADSTSFASKGTIQIDNERIEYNGNASNTLTLTLRGARNTVAERHADGATVTLYNVATIQAKIQPDMSIIEPVNCPYIMVECFDAPPDVRETFLEWIMAFNISIVVISIDDDYAKCSKITREITSQVRSLFRSNAKDVSWTDNIDGIIENIGDVFVQSTTFSRPDDFWDGHTYRSVGETVVRVIFQSEI